MTSSRIETWEADLLGVSFAILSSEQKKYILYFSQVMHNMTYEVNT